MTERALTLSRGGGVAGEVPATAAPEDEGTPESYRIAQLLSLQEENERLKIGMESMDSELRKARKQAELWQQRCQDLTRKFVEVYAGRRDAEQVAAAPQLLAEDGL